MGPPSIGRSKFALKPASWHQHTVSVVNMEGEARPVFESWWVGEMKELHVRCIPLFYLHLIIGL